jgi:hypothetical protein
MSSASWPAALADFATWAGSLRTRNCSAASTPHYAGLAWEIEPPVPGPGTSHRRRGRFLGAAAYRWRQGVTLTRVVDWPGAPRSVRQWPDKQSEFAASSTAPSSSAPTSAERTAPASRSPCFPVQPVAGHGARQDAVARARVAFSPLAQALHAHWHHHLPASGRSS